jgi:hypothetical protein
MGPTRNPASWAPENGGNIWEGIKEGSSALTQTYYKIKRTNHGKILDFEPHFYHKGEKNADFNHW